MSLLGMSEESNAALVLALSSLKIQTFLNNNQTTAFLPDQAGYLFVEIASLGCDWTSFPPMYHQVGAKLPLFRLVLLLELCNNPFSYDSAGSIFCSFKSEQKSPR
ncbi:hypothetical protein Y032_0100g3289 [Ancylostoma ceylanicum]|uniref:Uncharacterized protein n=1 Tax=Ancylostoma ceylanicum TaxID=53326 RepID=A0A016TI80_9BILA|nr:hypothetical protein Y032_0100g3289 [Ancylostoma ceylanicum]